MRFFYFIKYIDNIYRSQAIHDLLGKKAFHFSEWRNCSTRTTEEIVSFSFFFFFYSSFYFYFMIESWFGRPAGWSLWPSRSVQEPGAWSGVLTKVSGLEPATRPPGCHWWTARVAAPSCSWAPSLLSNPPHNHQHPSPVQSMSGCSWPVLLTVGKQPSRKQERDRDTHLQKSHTKTSPTFFFLFSFSNE